VFFTPRSAEQVKSETAEAELAVQVPGLMILHRCRYGDDFCAAFYTQPKRAGSFGPDHRDGALTSDEGLLILNIFVGEIACVEFLKRNDFQQKLDEAFSR
jgi:hypothetical protein